MKEKLKIMLRVISNNLKHLTLMVAFLCLSASGTVAQSTVQNDGAVVEQVPCAPNTISTYEQYLESSRRRFADEVEAAKRAGLHGNRAAKDAAKMPDGA